MRLRSVQSVVAAASLLSLVATPALAVKCAKNTEATALRTRMMQTELMVAALSCNQKTEYNDFVVHFRPELKQHGSALQSYFRRTYGKSGTSQLNTFTTRLANEVSQRSMKDIAAFCGDAAKTFSTLKSLPSLQFASFVAGRPTADSHGVGVCTVEASAEKPAKSKTIKTATAKTTAKKVKATPVSASAPAKKVQAEPAVAKTAKN